MDNQTNLVLSLNSDAFNELKQDFDDVLRSTLTNMELKGSDIAKMTVTLDISLVLGDVPDFEAPYEATRQIIKPTFKHKASSVMQIKDEKSGRLGGEYELVWDKELMKYTLRPLEISNGQKTLYSEGKDASAQETLYITPSLQLQAPQEEYLDVDSREVDDEEDVLGSGDDFPADGDSPYEYDQPNKEGAQPHWKEA